MEAMIFNIQRFSIHDGPGIRTTVFLKGCNLRCFWCHNPESWQSGPQIQVFPQKCIGCGACLTACPRGCHVLSDAGERIFHREQCTACGACAAGCYAEALVLTGYSITVDKLMEEVMKDEVFYRNSGGGVTFSGGECMLQADFLEAALTACRDKGLHRTVDTAGNVPFEAFERIMPLTDLFLYDLKCVTPELHRQGTGVGNERILANLEGLLKAGKNAVWVRIPVVPGFNAGDAEMEKMARYLQSLPAMEKVELLPYHRLGEGKRTSLGQASGPVHEPPGREEMDRYKAIFTDKGLPAAHS